MNPSNERALHEALRPLRPDADAFREAVERKLAERSAAAERAEADERRPLRQAASVLPLGLLEPTLAGGSAAALGKKLGAQAALAFPVLSVAMLGLTFVAGFRTLTRLRTGDPRDDEVVTAAMRGWWRAHAVHALVALAVLVVLVVTQPGEALLAFLFVSMLAVIGLTARLSSAGAATRATVGRFTASVLGVLLCGMAFFPGFAAGLRTVHVADAWVAMVLLVGFFACHYAGAWSRAWSTRRKCLTVAAPSASLALLAAALHTFGRPPSESAMVEFVEHFDRPVASAHSWEPFGHTAEWLTSRGVDFDAARARRLVDEAARERRGETELFGGDLGPFSLWGAARAAAISDELWTAISNDRFTGHLLTASSPLTSPRQNDVSIRALLRAGRLDEGARDHLATRVLDGWRRELDEPLGHEILEDMARRVELLDLLERPIALDAYRDDVHHALGQLWTGRSAPRPYAAPFAPGLALLDARSGWFRGRRPDFYYVDSTHDAVLLMQRFGVPDGIELDRVRAFLEHAATPSMTEVLAPRVFEYLTTQPYRYRAAVALWELVDSPGTRPEPRGGRSVASLVVSERVLVGAILLVALCLFGTLRVSSPAVASGN